MKRILALATASLLCGCATLYPTAPTLGRGDTEGFQGKGITFDVAYSVASGEDDTVYAVTPGMPAAKVEEIHRARIAEVRALLDGYGFAPPGPKAARYVVRITESGQATEEDSLVLMMLSSFSMLILPHPYTGTVSHQYELWSGKQKLNTVSTTARVKKWFGLIGLPLLAINATGAVDQKARTAAHDSVISTWIEQGAFE